MYTQAFPKVIIQDLGDGLILRRSTPADAEPLSEFNSVIHSDDGPDQPDLRVKAWTYDLLARPHPTFSPDDCTIVEETATGRIVSSMNLISQTWSYAGIPFKVGRPELVGTLPEYRSRGLIRKQFEVVHQWSAARGEQLQAITGIPYYYRLFGYEMGLALHGGKVGFRSSAPQLRDGERDPYNIRPATPADIPFLHALYELGCQNSLINCIWNEDLWRYELTGKSDQNVNRFVIRIVETPAGEPVAFFTHPVMAWGEYMVANRFEIKPGASWAAITPTVIRYLLATGEEYTRRDGKPLEKFGAFGFWLGTEHPVYDALHDTLVKTRKPYAWFVRVADLPGFLKRIRPVLEQRLAASPYAGYSGELRITFYRTGLRIKMEAGRLVEVSAWRPEPQGHSGQIAFPDLTFLQLMFGYRSLDDLLYAFADCWYENDTVYGLVNALFPKTPSKVWPIA